MSESITMFDATIMPMQTRISDFDIKTTHERTIVDLAAKGFRHASRIGKYAYSAARRQLDRHVHPDMIEICYCDRGQQVYEVRRKKYQIKGGDVFVTFPGEPHSTGNLPEERGILYWLQIQIPKDKTSFLEHKDEYAETLIDALIGLPSRHFKGVANMKKMLEEVLGLLRQENTAFNRLVVYNKLTNFLLAVVDCAHTGKPKLRQVTRIDDVKLYIENHLDLHLSIEKLAVRENLSESHFKGWFKKEVGVTPMDYVTRRKIEKAKQWLVNKSATPITQIAFDLGFSSSQYFATVFKQYTGVTPSEFRGGHQ